MFDSSVDLTRMSGSEMATLIAANAAELRERETRVLLLAAAWADLHDQDPEQPYAPLVERACAYGGPGTPEVAEFCAAEFGTLQGLSFSRARAVIADALDLRHRLPRLWAQVLAGEVRAWQAQQVAAATRRLSWEAAADVDHAISGYLSMLPWRRFLPVLAAAILDADPEAARERQERARTERSVWAGEDEHGLKSLVARADSGEVTWFMAAVNRIADILKARGDRDPVGARRAKAIGILAQPARALRLLTEHAADPDPHTGQPAGAWTCDPRPAGWTTGSMDLDHTRPYLPMIRGGPPGQTGPGNLGPLTRTSHRAATAGRWQKRQPTPGVFAWRSPHGWIYLVTNQGTLPLGNNRYAHAVWAAAAPAATQAA